MSERELTTKEVALKYCSELKEYIIAMTEIKEKTAEHFSGDPKRQQALGAMIEFDPEVKEAYIELEELMEKFIG
jgi:hypothetical protein